MKILGTGLSGLVGTRISQLLSPHHTLVNLSLETGVDITDINLLKAAFKSNQADIVLHMAAYTDVDGAEKDRINGENGLVWKVNVGATRNIASICRENRMRMIYISTDYVFDGQKSGYSEDDKPNPQGWYGITKYQGELAVSEINELGTIIRIANPYRHVWEGKPDFVHKILDRLKSGLIVKSPSDQAFVPTHIDDISSAINKLLELNASGIYHVVGSQSLSPFEAAKMIAAVYQIKSDLVSPTTFSDFFTGRAPSPFQAHLTNVKITNCGIHMKTFVEGLNFIKKAEGGK
jgi:dTDP-4-dehydrorhamnose reductase